ncbi:RluA family pseudouridine synthase [Magnetococcus sp. PR-3]|uniref:RluA family pseudouridine synthase n=1 Tax=Magnetococcus sp. PR-3 TaxID=3120355 RepID=UPI002FCDEFCA
MPENSKPTSVRTVTVDEEYAGSRLDKFLKSQIPGVPFSLIQRLMRTGQVRVNKGRAKGDRRLAYGDLVRIPPVHPPKTEQSDGKRQAKIKEQAPNIEARTVFRDGWILVLNKPAGIPVHGGSGHDWGIVDAVRASLEKLGIEAQAELCHRLDKDTSGLLLFGLRPRAVRQLTEAMRENKVGKTYLALVQGVPEKRRGVIEQPLSKGVVRGGERMVTVEQGGQEAVTHYRVVRDFGSASLVEVQLETGRTHQIRVHMQHLGHPVAGDGKYGDKTFNKWMRERGLKRLFLHASELIFAHPHEKRMMTYQAPLEAELQKVVDRMLWEGENL